MTRRLRSTGLTRTERREHDGIENVVDALAILLAADDVPPGTKELEKAMEGDSTRRSKWIIAAEQKGYIERQEQGRSKVCRLTDKGRELHLRRVNRADGEDD